MDQLDIYNVPTDVGFWDSIPEAEYLERNGFYGMLLYDRDMRAATHQVRLVDPDAHKQSAKETSKQLLRSIAQFGRGVNTVRLRPDVVLSIVNHRKHMMEQLNMPRIHPMFLVKESTLFATSHQPWYSLVWTNSGSPGLDEKAHAMALSYSVFSIDVIIALLDNRVGLIRSIARDFIETYGIDEMEGLDIADEVVFHYFQLWRSLYSLYVDKLEHDARFRDAILTQVRGIQLDTRYFRLPSEMPL